MCMRERGAGGKERGVRDFVATNLACGLADDRLKRFRQIVNQIARDHRYLPKFFRGQVAGQPCTCTPSRAASNGSSPWQSRAVMMPVSTSPEPPVAMPGLPVWLRLNRVPSVTTVCGL